MSSAVVGYGIRVDRLILMGRHNDIAMGHPEKFFDEEKFPALTVETADGGPYVGTVHFIFLKSSIAKVGHSSFVQFNDPKDADDYLEGVSQLQAWADSVGGHPCRPAMTLLP